MIPRVLANEAGKPALLHVIPFPALAGKPAMMPGPEISANVHARPWWELLTPQHEIVQRDPALTGFCVRAVTVNVSDKMPKFFQKDACFLHIAKAVPSPCGDTSDSCQPGSRRLSFQALILTERDPSDSR